MYFIGYIIFYELWLSLFYYSSRYAGVLIIEFSSLCYSADFQSYKTHSFAHILKILL